MTKRLKRMHKQTRVARLLSARAANGKKRSRPLLGHLFSRRTLLVLALASLAGLVYYLYQSPYFRISKITVIGIQRVKEGEVVQAAGVEGLSILSVSTKATAAKVKTLPLVKNATASLVLPNEVVVSVEERYPSAIWQSGTTKYFIDDEGVVLGPASGKTEGMITVTESPTRTLQLGNRVEAQAVQLARNLVEAMPREMGVAPHRFDYSLATGLTVTTDQGWQVRFGDGSDLAYKMAEAKGILAIAKETKQKVSLLDLRFGDRPYFR